MIRIGFGFQYICLAVKVVQSRLLTGTVEGKLSDRYIQTSPKCAIGHCITRSKYSCKISTLCIAYFDRQFRLLEVECRRRLEKLKRLGEVGSKLTDFASLSSDWLKQTS